MEELVMPNYDNLSNELVQNSSRRKQRCPRPVKAKRGRGRPRKSDPGGYGTPARSTPKRRSTQTKEPIDEDDEEEDMEEEEEEGEEPDVNDEDDPEYVVNTKKNHLNIL